AARLLPRHAAAAGRRRRGRLPARPQGRPHHDPRPEAGEGGQLLGHRPVPPERLLGFRPRGPLQHPEELLRLEGRRGRPPPFGPSAAGGFPRAVELFSRIARPSLHSKALTDGAGVTSHEETWSSARTPRGVAVRPSGGEDQPSPAVAATNSATSFC